MSACREARTSRPKPGGDFYEYSKELPLRRYDERRLGIAALETSTRGRPHGFSIDAVVAAENHSALIERNVHRSRPLHPALADQHELAENDQRDIAGTAE